MQLKNLPLDDINIVSNGHFDAMSNCDVVTGMDTFTYIENRKYLHYIENNPLVKCVLCTSELIEEVSKIVVGVSVCKSPKIEFFKLHNKMCTIDKYLRPKYKTVIGMNCDISPLAHIDSENIKIGNNVLIEEFVSIKQNTVIGDNVIIRSGTIIGCEGYEYKKEKSTIFHVTHIGGVIIGNNVDIFANTCICKAVFPWDNTAIGEYTKIDNLVHIGHACKIGRRNLIVAGSVFCGSAITEDDVYIGPNATVAKISMANQSKASLGAVVIGNVESGKTVSGNFAVDHIKMLRHTSDIIRR